MPPSPAKDGLRPARNAAATYVQERLVPTTTIPTQARNGGAPRGTASLGVATHAVNEYGSFKDSRKSPIHRWFEYPAGYSHRLVEVMIRRYNLGPESLLVDPFLGSGTTTLSASSAGIASVGVEAHKFVAWVAKTKCTAWNHGQLLRVYDGFLDRLTDGGGVDGIYPDLIYKCFTNKALKTLTSIKRAIEDLGPNSDFFKLALVATLRNASIAGTGWPYIAPTKYGRKATRPDALEEFKKRCKLMLDDVKKTELKAPPKVVAGDSRHLSRHVSGGADLVVTSPPYLNNYDYADRTRFETYFMGIYSDWGDITRHVRNRLMTAATTQVTVARDSEKATMPTIREISPTVHKDISQLVRRMSSMRGIKPGKKRYDLMTGGYFEDLALSLVEMNAVIRPGGHAVIVLGDSAPYGVHVRTDKLVGRIAKAAGFKSYKIDLLRERGGKWRSNPQRHHVELRETITTLSK